jgi:phosphatidate cytidylyltransferase
MLKYRLVTGPILILLLLGSILLDDRLDGVALGNWVLPRGILLFVIGLVVAALAAIEVARIVRATGIASRAWLAALAAMVGLAASYCLPRDTEVVTAVAIVASGMAVVLALSLLTFSRGQNTAGVLAATGGVMLSMVYIGFMLGFLLALRREHSAWWIVGVILTTKACDTGAYFTGRAIGRHKLIPWLSPGKTWEGLIGGVLTSSLAGLGLAAASQAWLDGANHVPLGVGFLCGAVFGLVGQFGDLSMSLLKRDAGLKDSSSLLPGLGGTLDVLDSPLMVAPVAFWMLTLMTSG